MPRSQFWNGAITNARLLQVSSRYTKYHQKDYIDSGKVNLVFKDYPLNGDDSVLAAEASHCASEQGRYWQYHDELYKNWGGERDWLDNKGVVGEICRHCELESRGVQRMP